MILRAHLFVEREITAILEALLPDPSQIRWEGRGSWQYSTRVDLFAALNLDDTLQIEAYRYLGTLRNDVAHNLGSEVTKAKQNILIDRLTPDFRKTVKAATKGKPFPEPLRFTLTLLVLQLSANRHARSISV